MSGPTPMKSRGPNRIDSLPTRRDSRNITAVTGSERQAALDCV